MSQLLSRAVPSALLLVLALSGCMAERPDPGADPDPDHGSLDASLPDGTYRVEAPLWQENNCGAPQEIEASYTFSPSAGGVRVAEVPGLLLERRPSGDLAGDLRWTEDLRAEGIDCSFDFDIYFELEPMGDGTYEGTQRIQIDHTPFGDGADCASEAMARYGFSSWERFGCHWEVRYALMP